MAIQNAEAQYLQELSSKFTANQKQVSGANIPYTLYDIQEIWTTVNLSAYKLFFLQLLKIILIFPFYYSLEICILRAG